MKFAPIIVFAFNRPDVLKNTLEALRNNSLAEESDLYIFVDGPRHEGDVPQVAEVKRIVDSVSGFKTVTRRCSDKNKGLANSIIGGVTEIINLYGRVIVVEDDLIVASNFLSFMNQGLEKYEDEKRVFSICGYSNRIKVPKEYQDDAYFCVRSSSWGWATWSNRWSTIDWDLKNWDEVQTWKRAFNKWGGSDSWKMLNDWHEGRNSSWAIRFCFAQFLQNKLTLFPTISKVRNNGFDGRGTNCKHYSRFKCDFDHSNRVEFSFPANVYCLPVFYKQAMKYNSIMIRIFSRIMYMIKS